MPTSSVLAYIVINLDPVLLRLGPLQIHWYGLAYVLAITVGLNACLRYADGLGVPRALLWQVFIGTAIAGLVGGRLYFVIQQPDLVQHYLLNPINIIAVWNGGMAFFGAIFLGAPTLAVLAHRAGLSPWLALDIGGLFAAVGQMFGRLGNLVNGDIVGYAVGIPSLPGAVCAQAPCIAFVPDAHILPWATVYLNPASFVTQIGVAYQPAAAYEILWNLIALAILWPLRERLPRQVRAGALFCLYLAMYAISQFVLFFWRSNLIVTFLGISGLKQAQWTAIFTLLIAAAFYWLVVRRFGQPWAHDAAHPLPAPPLDAVAVAAPLAFLPGRLGAGARRWWGQASPASPESGIAEQPTNSQAATSQVFGTSHGRRRPKRQ